MATPQVPRPAQSFTRIAAMVAVVAVVFVIAGWLLAATWALMRLAVVVLVVAGIIWAVQTVRR